MKPQQCRAARALIGLSRPELGLVARVGKNTIQAFEAGRHRASRTTIKKLRAAFASFSVRFTEDEQGIGVQRNLTLAEVETREDFVDKPTTAPPIVEASSRGAPISSAQARAARAFLGLSQMQAATMSGVGLSLLVALETEMRTPRLSNILKIKYMYESKGIAFTEINGVPAIQAVPPLPPDRAASETASLCPS